MNVMEAVKSSEKMFSKPTMEKSVVIEAMDSVDSTSSWEEQNNAARLFLDNKNLFTNEEIVSISQEFVSRTGFKPKK